MAVLTILPSLLYLSLFSLHFSLLTKVALVVIKIFIIIQRVELEIFFTTIGSNRNYLEQNLKI